MLCAPCDSPQPFPIAKQCVLQLMQKVLISRNIPKKAIFQMCHSHGLFCMDLNVKNPHITTFVIPELHQRHGGHLDTVIAQDGAPPHIHSGVTANSRHTDDQPLFSNILAFSLA
ncbi:hypothetical protein NPIL_590191 [Nephila pilipes]|uniref:Uncharacterized protein n=1 Tax=Nephila pilipes TaxID=299642 RepID=A0A8X6NQR1_NEPPI|nr:hypothetical protein NPIL_590191 [Nephila pilipes]